MLLLNAHKGFVDAAVTEYYDCRYAVDTVEACNLRIIVNIYLSYLSFSGCFFCHFFKYGPHHGAQKSTITGNSASITSFLKVKSPVSCNILNSFVEINVFVLIKSNRCANINSYYFILETAYK